MNRTPLLALLTTLLVASAFVGAQGTGASAATCQSWGAQPPNVGTSSNVLAAVTVGIDVRAQSDAPSRHELGVQALDGNAT